MKMPQPYESELQENTCQLLDVHERMGRLLYFAVPNGGWRNRTVAAKLKAQGVRAGVPDMLVLFPGARIQFWELKRPGSKGPLKKDQLGWQKELEAFGFDHFVIRSLRDVEDALAIAVAA